MTFSGFINQIGEQLQQFLFHTATSSQNIILCIDNVDLPLGSYKFSNRLPNNYHNALGNVRQKLPTQKFRVLQIGIDRRPPLADWVLSVFPPKELNRLHSEIFPQL